VVRAALMADGGQDLLLPEITDTQGVLP
jgi:hypothetical protein